MSREESKYAKGTRLPRDVGFDRAARIIALEEKRDALARRYNAADTLYTEFAGREEKALHGNAGKLLWELAYWKKSVADVARAEGVTRQSVYNRLAAAGVNVKEQEEE